MLSFAAEHASRTSAELLLVHAFGVWPVAPDADELKLHLRQAEHQAGEVLRRAEEEARAHLGADVVVTTRMVRGPVVGVLVNASEEAELVVVQRRDRPLIARVLTRSFSCGVASRAHVSVAVVPERRPSARHDVVTVAVDVPQRSSVLLHRALEEASRRGATLRVVHALWHVGGLGEYLVEQATATRHLARARSDVERAVADAQRGHPQVAVDIDVRRVEPASALVLESGRSDLLLVERHDPVLTAGSHLGPVAAAVVRDYSCPVFVVAPTHRHRQSTDQGGASS